MSTYTEDHLVEQPAIQLMQHELGWDVVNCYDEPSSLTILRRGFERQELRRSWWSGGVSNQGRDGKREGGEILNFGFWILNGRGRRPTAPRLNPFHLALRRVESNREIDKLRWPSGLVLFAPEPDRQRNRLGINEFLFELKTSEADSPLGETQRLSEIPVRKLMKSLLSRNRENGKSVKIGLSFTENSLFTTT